MKKNEMDTFQGMQCLSRSIIKRCAQSNLVCPLLVRVHRLYRHHPSAVLQFVCSGGGAKAIIADCLNAFGQSVRVVVTRLLARMGPAAARRVKDRD